MLTRCFYLVRKTKEQLVYGLLRVLQYITDTSVALYQPAIVLHWDVQQNC